MIQKNWILTIELCHMCRILDFSTPSLAAGVRIMPFLPEIVAVNGWVKQGFHVEEITEQGRAFAQYRVYEWSIMVFEVIFREPWLRCLLTLHT